MKKLLPQFNITKISIQAFIPNPIKGFYYNDGYENLTENDLLEKTLFFKTELGEKGCIKRMDMGSFILYKLIFNNRPNHIFTSSEFEIIRPYLGSGWFDYFNRLKELKKIYIDRKQKGKSIRKQFLDHIKNGMIHFQQLFQKDLLKKADITKSYSATFWNKDLFDFPTFGLLFHCNKLNIPFQFGLN